MLDTFDQSTLPANGVHSEIHADKPVQMGSPIFVLGTPFSGNTVLAWALAQHPHIHHVLDNAWLAKLALDLQATYEAARDRTDSPYLPALPDTPAEFFAPFGEAVNRVFQLPGFGSNGDSVCRWVDCTPSHAFNIPALVGLFPNAKFIHIISDIESVANALVNREKAQLPRGAVQYRGNFDAASAIDLWMETTKAVTRAEVGYGSEKILRVHYRTLLSEPEDTLGRCLAFLNEPYNPACLRPLVGLKEPPRFHDDAIGPAVVIPEDVRFFSDLLALGPSAGPGPDPQRILELEQQQATKVQHTETMRPGAKPRSLNDKIKAAAESILARDSSVLVISKGDDELVRILGPKAGHFPQNADGTYLGYHPSDSAEAISQLERLRKSGRQFLIIPSPYLWWLDYYLDFRKHLQNKCRIVFYQEDTCIVYALQSPTGGAKPPYRLRYHSDAQP